MAKIGKKNIKKKDVLVDIIMKTNVACPKSKIYVFLYIYIKFYELYFLFGSKLSLYVAINLEKNVKVYNNDE